MTLDGDRCAGSTERIHPLPELLDDVLNGSSNYTWSGGWAVVEQESEIVVSTYDEPPETGGELTEVATFDV